MDRTDRLLTLAEVAAELGLSHETIYRLVRAGQLPGLKVGTQWRFDRAQLRAYLRSVSSATAAPADGFLIGETMAVIAIANLIVNHLTEHGAVDAARLYQSPFTDVTPHGPDALLAVLDKVRATAAAA